MDFQKIKIGYVPTRRTIFSVEEALRYREVIKEAISNPDVEIVDINDLNEEGLLVTQDDVLKVVKKMRDHAIDALFFPHCNFGSEGVVAQVAASFKLPVLIYGPRDEGPDETGMRLRDSQCGVFATGKVLRRHNVPFSYIASVDPQSEEFKRGFDRFVRVASVVRAMRNMRVLQLGPRPNDFLSVMINESELLEKFGIQVFPVALPDLDKIMKQIIAEAGEEFVATCSYIKDNYTGNGTGEQDIRAYAGLKLAIKHYAAVYHCNCAAVQCWDAMQDIMGIYPCAVNALMAEEGFPVACETDIHGAISAVLLQAATGNKLPHFLADVTIRHPQENNTELLWHCGPFPKTFAKEGEECKITNSWLGGPHCGNCAFEMKNGDITVCRFDGDNGQYSLFIGEGKGVDGPKTRGTYVWFQVDDWLKWEYKLVKGPYIHHVAGTYANVSEILYEACSYIPGLRPDPVSPNGEELEKRWRS
ncbi:MAG: L-fucose/L-arabinose isomerase family protein [Christensenellales bacterium]|jgi:L-fucose isomerase-like protein